MMNGALELRELDKLVHEQVKGHTVQRQKTEGQPERDDGQHLRTPLPRYIDDDDGTVIPRYSSDPKDARALITFLEKRRGWSVSHEGTDADGMHLVEVAPVRDQVAPVERRGDTREKALAQAAVAAAEAVNEE